MALTSTFIPMTKITFQKREMSKISCLIYSREQSGDKWLCDRTTASSEAPRPSANLPLSSLWLLRALSPIASGAFSGDSSINLTANEILPAAN